MKKLKGKISIQVILLILAAVCLIVMLRGNNQAIMGIPIPQTFSGEYSRDGETWLPLAEDAELSALDGDLFYGDISAMSFRRVQG